MKYQYLIQITIISSILTLCFTQFSCGGGSHSGEGLIVSLSAPAQLSAKGISSKQIFLTWTDPNTLKTNFVIERSSDGVKFIVIDTVSLYQTKYSDIPPMTETTYYYRIKTRMSNQESEYSNIDDALTLKAPILNEITKLSSYQVELRWIDNSSKESGFLIERSVDGVTFTEIVKALANSTVFLDETVTPNRYHYRIRAFDSNENISSYSATVDVLVHFPKIPVVEGWPKTFIGGISVNSVDMDSDGIKEVFVKTGTWIYDVANLWVFNLDGTNYSSDWPKVIHDPISTPAFGDLDGDKNIETVFTSFHFNCGIGKINSNFFVLNSMGENAPGWPVSIPDICFATEPVIADIDPSIPGLEIAFATRVYTTSSKNEMKLFAFDKNGNNVQGFPKSMGFDCGFQYYPSPIIGDIDGDKINDIIVGIYRNSYGYILAYDINGQKMNNWPHILATHQFNPTALAMGDLDNNGTVEIVVATSLGSLIVIDNKGNLFDPVWANFKTGASVSDMVLADLDMDGDLEIIIGGYGDNRIYAIHHDGKMAKGWPVYTGAPFPCRVRVGAIGDIGDIVKQGTFSHRVLGGSRVELS